MSEADDLLARAHRLLEDAKADRAKAAKELKRARGRPVKRAPEKGRRHETPRRRVNPSGKTVWVARATDRYGGRVFLGTRELKRDAQRLMDDFYDEEYESDRRAGEALSVRLYFKTWLRRHPRHVSTEAAYVARVRRALPVLLDGVELGDWPMDRLRPREASDFLDHLLRVEGRAAAGARAVVNTLKAMWSDAVRDDVASVNPWKDVRVSAKDPRVTKAPRDATVWTWAQMHDLAAVSRAPELIRTLSDCGLRLGEARFFERAGVRLNGCEDDGCPAGGVPHLHVDGKTGKRVAPVPDELAAMLRAMPPRLDTRLMFPAPRGGAWEERWFYREVWYPARDAMPGMGRAVPHDFRHSWVSRMRAAQIDPADAAAAAGHSLETATRTYTHPLGASFELMRKAVGP